jgi:hypothetical protein
MYFKSIFLLFLITAFVIVNGIDNKTRSALTYFGTGG